MTENDAVNESIDDGLDQNLDLTERAIDSMNVDPSCFIQHLRLSNYLGPDSLRIGFAVRGSSGQACFG